MALCFASLMWQSSCRFPLQSWCRLFWVSWCREASPQQGATTQRLKCSVGFTPNIRSLGWWPESFTLVSSDQRSLICSPPPPQCLLQNTSPHIMQAALNRGFFFPLSRRPTDVFMLSPSAAMEPLSSFTARVIQCLRRARSKWLLCNSYILFRWTCYSWREGGIFSPQFSLVYFK